MQSPGVTVVGLGLGAPEGLTLQAAEVLRHAGEIWVRTARHPSLPPLRDYLAGTTIHSFDDLYEQHGALPAVDTAIADRLTALAERPSGVVFAVPGSPTWGQTALRLLRERGVPVRLVHGISTVDGVLAAVDVSDASWIEALDGSEVALLGRADAVGQVDGQKELLPWRSPVTTAGLVISPLYDRATASGVQRWLCRYYPDSHSVRIVTLHAVQGDTVRELPLHRLDQEETIDHRTALYVPPLPETENVRTFAGLMNVTRALRAPGGCPWDREQTHASLKTYLLEEAYEVIEALDRADPTLLAEELGDLLFQICIHSQVAAEAGDFAIEDVIAGITSKMVGRHPHVFADAHLETAQDVRSAWEGMKQREKPKRASILEEIPRSLPALPQSQLIQKRAASVGFEWPDVHGVFAKVQEEIDELRDEIVDQGPKEAVREELGDVFFALVSVARHLRLDPEEALRLANAKFGGRFRAVEISLAGTGKTLRDLSPEQLDELWNSAKAQEPRAAQDGRA